MARSFIVVILCCFALSLSAQNGQPPYHRLVKKTEKRLAKLEKQSSAVNIRSNTTKAPLHTYPSEVNPADLRRMPHTPDQFWQQEWIATMNPALGRPTPELLFEEVQRQNQSTLNRRAMPGTTKTTWTSRGPNNLAGRTRALAIDPIVSSGKKVWAGAVTGGLWYNDDITSASSTWKFVSGLWSNLTVTCIAFDPNAPGTMYVGTGEGWGSTPSSSRGFGVFKSIDSGKTFTQLAATKTYYFVNDLVVRSESGKSVIYCATDMQFVNGAWHGTTTGGLMKSTNGGVSFTNVMPKIPSYTLSMIPADLEIGADNRLWIG
ncbi:MAG: hypothetical protein RIR98_1706, partial [Bacteroidota bacterium]